MSTFPRLKTGAVAQYPASKVITYATELFRFLDGTEQRYRAYGRPVQSWVIQLDLLDDTELSQILEFFNSAQGRFGTFSFVDPWDGTTHTNCSFDSDEIDASLSGEARAKLSIVVRENLN